MIRFQCHQVSGQLKGLVTILAPLLLIVSCSSISEEWFKPGVPPAASLQSASSLQQIVISPQNATLWIGSTQSYTATGYYSDKSSQDITNVVTWGILPQPNGGVSISSGGVLDTSGAEVGTLTINATFQGITGSTGLTLFTASAVWVSGSSTANSPDSSVPGARQGSAIWTDSSGNIWVFGGCDAFCDNTYNDLWKYDGSSWTWVSGSTGANATGSYGQQGVGAPSNTPGARGFPSFWQDPDGNLWLFGGLKSYTPYEVYGDLWKFDGSDWIWMNGDSSTCTSGNYGDKGITRSTNYPPGLIAATAVRDKKGNAWVFGGMDCDDGNFNHLWKFDGRDWTWIAGSNQANPAGSWGTKGITDPSNVPSPRNTVTMWEDSGTLWVFGGQNASLATHNDLWKFDGTNWTWVSGSNRTGDSGQYGVRNYPEATNTPGARAAALGWTDNSGNLWLFGGGERASYDYNDLWKFDGKNWTWVEGADRMEQLGNYGVQGVPNPSNFLGARDSMAGTLDAQGNLWVFGGVGCTSTNCNEIGDALNDLWRLSGWQSPW